MWSVIRKYQGLPQNECPYDSYADEQHYQHNQRCILMHEVRPNVPEMDPRIFTKAYDDYIFIKIRRWMLDEDASLREQALDELVALYVEQREHAARSLSYDALPLLISIMCTDEMHEVRERAATALELLLREPKTQRMLLDMESKEEAPLKRILAALQDPVDGVVVLVLRVIVACHAYHNQFVLTEMLVTLGFIQRCLELVCGNENVLVKAVACSALVTSFDVKEAFTIFLKNNGMHTVTETFAHDDAMLVAEAAEVVSRAGEFPQGKRDAVTCNTLAALLPYISHDNLTVRVAVAAAMAQLTILETAKTQAIECGLPEAILAMLPNEDERDVLVFIAKLSYNIAEHPKGRELLRSARERFGELMHLAGDDEAITRALADAMEILTRFRKFPAPQM